MRPGTRGCADTKDPALLGCEEAALICSAQLLLQTERSRLENRRDPAAAAGLFIWKKGGRSAAASQRGSPGLIWSLRLRLD